MQVCQPAPVPRFFTPIGTVLRNVPRLQEGAGLRASLRALVRIAEYAAGFDDVATVLRIAR